MNAVPEISIVVPTRDRPEALARCLAALERQRGCGPLEIVVVDDGSIEEERVAAAVATAPRARLLRLEGRGPAAARNAGARAALAPVLCFTDDDCEPRPDWAALLSEPLAGDADIVGGGVTDIRGDDNPQLLALRAMGAAFYETGGGELAFLGTINVGCRADVLRDVPFDERYPFASEDRDWSLRVRARGYRIVRRSEAQVLHTRTDTLTGFWRRHVRYGEGAYVFRRIHSGGRPSPPHLYLRMVRNGFRQGVRVGLLVLLSQVAAARGFARAARADRRARGVDPPPGRDGAAPVD